MNAISTIYNTQSLVILAITLLLWAGSHIFFALGLKNLDSLSRVLGFIGFVSLFFLAGIKGGLIAIPVVILFSFLGAIVAKKLMVKFEKT